MKISEVLKQCCEQDLLEEEYFNFRCDLDTLHEIISKYDISLVTTTTESSDRHSIDLTLSKYVADKFGITQKIRYWNTNRPIIPYTSTETFEE